MAMTEGDAAILKKLPVPVLVYRMGETLYANPELLAITGYASLDELSRRAASMRCSLLPKAMAASDGGQMAPCRCAGATDLRSR